jgi:hypothetical protein
LLKPGEKTQRVITVLVTWGVLLAVFGVYEWSFVKTQREFRENEALRTLKAVARGLNARVNQAQASTASFIGIVKGTYLDSDLNPNDKTKVSDAAKDWYLENYLDVTEKAKANDAANAAARCSEGNERFYVAPQLEWDLPEDDLTLAVRCSGTREPIVNYDIAPRRWTFDGLNAQSDTFDDVLVADATGSVRFQSSQTEPRIVDLRALVEGENEKSDKTAKADDRDPASDSRSRAAVSTVLEKLLQASAVTDIAVADVKYKLFSQPVHLYMSSPPQAGKTHDLIVCGLVHTWRFEKESHAVPYSTAIWAAMLGVALFSLSWPLFKLRYMSDTERFEMKAGWYLVLAIFLFSTSTTLMLINLSYTAWAMDAEDQILTKFASDIKHNFKHETEEAYAQLQELRSSAKTLAPALGQPPSVKSSYSLSSPCYPFFQSAYWTDDQGQQEVKVDLRVAPARPINMSRVPFFKAVMNESVPPPDANTLHCPNGPPSRNTSDTADEIFRRARIHPLLSPITDEFLTVLTDVLPEDTPPNKVPLVIGALTYHPISMVDPVLPPGYAFAVIDGDCKVLFHSEPFRNMKENFCEESENKHELRPLLVSGVDATVDISYLGQTERAFVTEMTGEQLSVGQLEGGTAGPEDGVWDQELVGQRAFLIVFRQPGVQLTLDLSIILVCSILLSAYFAVLVLSAVLHVSMRGPLRLIYPPEFIWPQPREAGSYIGLFVANSLLLFAFWVFYPHLFATPLLAMTLAVPACSILLLMLKLFSGKHIPFPRFIKRPRLLKESHQKYYGAAFTLMCVSMIASIAIVPCLGLFKYSYDVISELSLKHDQLALSQSLLARRERIHKYYAYENVQRLDGSEKMAEPEEKYNEPMENRLNSELDRYDRRFFTVKWDQKEVEHPYYRWAESGLINQLIEKTIARTTLSFPSNRLGSEIGGIRLASTNPRLAWEHTWNQTGPRTFTLSWKPESRIPALQITSDYYPWQGLQWWVYLGLVLLGATLTVWIMNVTTKIFSIGVKCAPPYEEAHWKSAADVGGNYLLITHAKSGESEWLESTLADGSVSWIDVRSELQKMIGDPAYRIDSYKGSIFVLAHFDYNLWDSTYNEKRLELLESLVYGTNTEHKLVVVSTVDPLYFLTEGGPAVCSKGSDATEARKLLSRWTQALSKFKRVRPNESMTGPFIDRFIRFMQEHPESRSGKFVVWVCAECNCTSMLRKIGIELFDEFRECEQNTRESVESEVQDRASAYYHVLWTSLTFAERLVLYQLALDGWINAKNGEAIQQLERKQLIYRAPMYRVMNESFRRFIQSAEHGDEMMEWQKQERASTWHAFRAVLIVAVLGVGVWMLYTQAALSQTVTGIIAGGTALLTAVGGLLGRFKLKGASSES